MYLKSIVLIALIVLGILFGISNQDLAVIHFFGYSSGTIPLYLILFVSFIAGSVVALAYGIRAGMVEKTRERVLLIRVRELQELMRQKYAQINQEASSEGGDESDET